MALLVTVAGAAYPVTRARLTLAAGAGPILRARFATKRPGDDVQAAAAELVPGALATSGGPLAFLTLGFERVADEPGGLRTKLEVVGLVLPPAVADWFSQKPAAGTRDTLVYQRRSEESAWLFFRRTLGGRFAAPAAPAMFDSLFPPRSCLWRGAAWDNGQYLARTIEAVRFRLPAVLGWFALAHENEPLQLIQADAAAPALGAGWSHADTATPHRLASPIPGACVRRAEFAAGDGAAFLRALATTADPTAARAAGQVLAPVRVLAGPAAVSDGGRIVFCRSVSYALSAAVGVVEAEAELVPLPDAPSCGSGPRFLTGGFTAWADAEPANAPRTLVGLSSRDRNWTMMGPTGEEIDDAPLLACALTPKAYQTGYAGLYARHKDGDPMEVLLECGAVPRAIGAAQVYHEPFELADLTLNGERLHLNVSERVVASGRADGLVLDGEARTATVQLNEQAARVVADGRNGRIAAGASKAVVLGAGLPENQGDPAPNRLVLDGEQGKVRIDVKVDLVANVDADPKLGVQQDQVRVMNNLTVTESLATVKKNVKVGGRLDMA